MPLSYRDVTIYPPFPGEVPTHLVGEGAADEVRIAKTADGRVVGAYRLARAAPCRFAIKALAVCEGFRGVGIGRWLLGHAVGVAESRGGRMVDAPEALDAPAAFLRKSGFERAAGGFRLRLEPE